MKKNMFYVILLLILIMPLKVSAAGECPDGYDLKGEWCVKYANTYKEYNKDVCAQGSKVTVDGKTKCEIRVAPTKKDSEQNKVEKPKEEEKTTVNCSKLDSGKECKCNDGYTLEGNECVKYTAAYQEFNQWHCTQGSKVTIDSKVKCKITLEPTIQNKVVNNQTSNNTGTNTTVGGFDFCAEDGVLKTFQIVGYIVTIIKILVPLLLLIFGSIDFGKAVLAGDDKGIQAASKMLVTRAIGGIIIFFIPTIVNFVTTMISNWSTVESSFVNCTTCLKSASDCESKRKALCSKPGCTWDGDMSTCNCSN